MNAMGTHITILWYLLVWDGGITLLQQEIPLPVLPPSWYEEWINASLEDGLQEQVLINIVNKLQEAESIEKSEVGVLWKEQKFLGMTSLQVSTLWYQQE